MHHAEAFPLPTDYVDRRPFATHNHTDGGNRPWKEITGICLHQTACQLGSRPERYDTLGAHFGVMRSGRVIHVHEMTRIVWHGNGWNNRTVGIEIDGLYAGIQGDQRTVWDDPSTPGREVGQNLTLEALLASQALIRWICTEVQSHGGEVTKLVAHRQSSKDRRNDPGSEIWGKVALPMSAELGLDDGGDGFEVGGYPIPIEWNALRATHRY